MRKVSKHHGHNTLAFVLIFFGLVILVDRTGIVSNLEWFSFRNLWPIIFVIIGVNTLSKTKNSIVHFFMGLGFLLTGGALLLRNFGLIPDFSFNWSILWPVLIIFLGLKMLFDNKHSRNTERAEEMTMSESESENTDNDYIDLNALLGSSDFHFSSKNLKRGNITAVLGGCKVVLTDADFKTDSLTINVLAFWGGIEIYIPKNWKLNVKAVPIMGGIEHKIISDENGVKKDKTLIITGTVIMAGVEIKS